MSRQYLDNGEPFTPRTYACLYHGTHDSPRCPICARLDDGLAARVAAIVETLHIHSKRLDEKHDLAMMLDARISDLTEVVGSIVRRLDALERREAERIADVILQQLQPSRNR